ncbi:MAG: hypothetical protein B1H03_03575 [Planctomycetales bacterium 4484_113]|nr:MAG: hypothetical protein B1H03_03575 [Planctomycetales bacterium 4484_113]
MRVALDPGTHKCGWAVECGLAFPVPLGIVNLDNLGAILAGLRRFFDASEVLIGDGTNAEEVADRAREFFSDTAVRIVDESGSTEEAKRLYLQTEGSWATRWLRYLLHLILNPPLDGYAAWGLLRRHKPLR